MARGLKFRIKKVEGLYYLCSEKKGANQLRSHRNADLRLCFRICKKPVFSQQGSFMVNKRIVKLNRSYLESAIFETCKISTFILMSFESTYYKSEKQ